MFEIKWVLTEEQKKTVKAWIKANYDRWCDEGKFYAEDAGEAAMKHFGFTTWDEGCDCEGLAEEVRDDKFDAEAYYWGVELGFIKEVK
jgi:hypothetical protein